MANSEAAVEKAMTVEVNVEEEILNEKPHIEVPGIVSHPEDHAVDSQEYSQRVYPDNVNPETGEITEEVPVQKYRFVIKIEETVENLQMLKDFLDAKELDYDQVGEVEKIEVMKEVQ